LLEPTNLIYGHSQEVPTRRGPTPYINFDNAASTPPFTRVMEALCREARWYASVHRGAGYKSQYSTQLYEAARQSVGKFVGVDFDHDVVIFTKNTTDSLNKLSHYLPFLSGEQVVYTGVEHHSNELPWASKDSYCIGLDGYQINLAETESYFQANAGRIKLLAVSGASNVTGYIPPIYTLAEIAHRAGAKILVDAAQLAAHHPIDVLPPSDPRHLDFVAFSAHKMYAPFGVGVLIGPREIFRHTPPSQVGGGTVQGIGPAGVVWSEPPDVEEAGSPNVLGAVALAEALKVFREIGWDSIIENEKILIRRTLEILRELPDVTLYNPDPDNRVGVISFNVAGHHHLEVAQYLAEEWGIGVRSGCFCARSYVQRLLNLTPTAIYSAQKKIINHQPQLVPGLVRVSFGCYNQLHEVEKLAQALAEFQSRC
jgi:cysteine desulfurase/selenocysteine lyase